MPARILFTNDARCVSRTALILFALCCIAGVARGQHTTVVGNDYVSATMITDTAYSPGGGRFVIDAGRAFSAYRFLYYVTSNVVFRVTAPGGPYYFTNAGSEFGGHPLQENNTVVPYVPFDRVDSSSGVAVTWNDLHGYSVTMRLLPEQPKAAVVKGADVLIEFSYHRNNGSTATDLGIFMMLDVYNGQAAGAGGTGDQASILTSSGYFPASGPGKLFGPGIGSDSIPRFYHVGDFRYESPLNTVLPVHRLIGTSHNGAGLTTPDLLALGNWRQLRFLSWDVVPADVSSAIGDAATVVRWDTHESAQGVVRTAFGMDDHDGNNLFHCRDTNLFVDIQTERMIVRSDSTAPNTATFDANVWVTNTSETADSLNVVLIAPGGSGSYVRLAANALPAKSVRLAPHETRLLTWPLEAKVANKDTAFYQLDLRYTIGSGAQARSFREQCLPLISLVGPSTNPDHFAPVVSVGGSRTNSGIRPLTIVDRHPGVSVDTGIDSVWVDPLQSFNMALVRFGVPVRCETDTIHGAVEVVDSAKPGRLVIVARDCAGHVTMDTVLYDVDVTDRWAPNDTTVVVAPGFPTRTWLVTIADRHAKFAHDTGLDSVWADAASLRNMTYAVTIPFVRCDSSSSGGFRVNVIDGAAAAYIKLYIRDCNANMDSVQLVYTPSAGVDERGGAAAGNALAIQEVHPQPLIAGSNGALDITVSNLTPRGAVAELIAADGRVVVRELLDGAAGSSMARSIPVPAALASGVYVLRVVGANGTDSRKVLITR
ncbi:MAG TPA: T9SS type A sorting domain-containing protein [Candidatus Kapabacteria bacterium]|nr:T9SS type A sorting domain-containing protein [Candidatus Kapabacteria bacterium]